MNKGIDLLQQKIESLIWEKETKLYAEKVMLADREAELNRHIKDLQLILQELETPPQATPTRMMGEQR